MKKYFCAAVAAVAFATASGASAQSFEGSTLDYQYYFPTSGSPYSGADNGSFVVGAGIEVTNIADQQGTLDVSGTNILIDFTGDSSWTNADFNGWVLSDQSDSLAEILGVTINGATNLGGFSLSNLSWTGDSITVNWQGLDFDANTVVSLDVAFNGTTPAVPEPATWAMMLMGFGVAGSALRRSRRSGLSQAQVA